MMNITKTNQHKEEYTLSYTKDKQNHFVAVYYKDMYVQGSLKVFRSKHNAIEYMNSVVM